MGMFCFWMGDGISEWILKEEDLVGFVAGHVEHRFQLQLFLTRLCEFPQRQWCWARPGHPELLEHQGLLSTLQLLQFDSDSTSSCILSTVFPLSFNCQFLTLHFLSPFGCWHGVLIIYRFEGRACRIMWSQRDPSLRKSCSVAFFVARTDPKTWSLGGFFRMPPEPGRLKGPDRLTCHSDFPFCLGLLPTLSWVKCFVSRCSGGLGNVFVRPPVNLEPSHITWSCMKHRWSDCGWTPRCHSANYHGKIMGFDHPTILISRSEIWTVTLTTKRCTIPSASSGTSSLARSGWDRHCGDML